MNQVREQLMGLAFPLSNLPGMVFRCRRDEERTIEFISDGCQEVTGYEPEDLLFNASVAYNDLIFCQDRERVEAAIAGAVHENRPFQISYRLKTREGREKWVWEQGEGVFPEDGEEAVAVESIVVDITPRTEATTQIETQDRLATVGQMATGIAHDFNNIMSVIVLYSGLLEKQPNHPRRHEYLTVISRQAHHASRLIGKLLDYSRDPKVDEGPLNLNSFLDEMMILLERALPENINVRVESSLEDAFVQADPTRLHQVIFNLVLNARDAMPQGGHLTIRLSELKVGHAAEKQARQSEEERCARIEVTDTGEGIPADQIPRIFEPFYTTKEPGQGTGLGLAQVAGIVEQLGGTVSVQSRLGIGTTFQVELPLVPWRQMSQDPDGQAAAKAKTGETLLIVEDRDETLEAIVEATRSLGYNVLTARSGQEALKTFESESGEVEMLITDAVMPDSSGIELCKLIRNRQANLACVVMSGYSLDVHRQQLLEEEKVYWLQKPFTLDMLAKLLRRALGG